MVKAKWGWGEAVGEVGGGSKTLHLPPYQPQAGILDHMGSEEAALGFSGSHPETGSQLASCGLGRHDRANELCSCKLEGPASAQLN